MAVEKKQGKLFLIPTPIGNLEDITLRALNVLKSCDLILCEDTRTSSILLKHYQIQKPLQSFHKFNEHQQLDQIFRKVSEGMTIGYISDAGTPGISDPGYLLAREAHVRQVDVTCLPGSTAFVPALVQSGLPCDSFVFEGFIPQKKGKQTKINQISDSPITTVAYESPHRLLKTLEMLQLACGPSRKVSISREISKLYEETFTGTIAEVLQYFGSKEVKGEIVLVIEGKPKNNRSHNDEEME